MRSHHPDRQTHERRSHAGKGYLVRILATYLSVPEEDVVIDRTLEGKPTLGESHALEFSVSHSEGLLLIGVGTGTLGVDVELLRPLPDLDSIAALTFTDRERDFLDSDYRGRLEAFFHLWTAKEAVLKGLGHGFGIDPLSVDLRPTPWGFDARSGPCAAAAWSIVSLTAADSTGTQAMGAVAVPGPPPHVCLKTTPPTWRVALPPPAMGDSPWRADRSTLP